MRRLFSELPLDSKNEHLRIEPFESNPHSITGTVFFNKCSPRLAIWLCAWDRFCKANLPEGYAKYSGDFAPPGFKQL